MIGVLFAAIEIASGFGSLAAGRAMRCGDPQKTMLSGTVASILFICATPFLGGIFLLAAAGADRARLAAGLVQPMMFSVQAKAVGRYRQGSVVGLRQTANRLSSIVIPPIMGVIADWWGMTESFVVLGVALLLVCVPIARITRRAAQAPAVARGARAGLRFGVDWRGLGDAGRTRSRSGPDYDEDFYAWTQYQAEVLRSMPCDDNRFDREQRRRGDRGFGQERAPCGRKPDRPHTGAFSEAGAFAGGSAALRLDALDRRSAPGPPKEDDRNIAASRRKRIRRALRGCAGSGAARPARKWRRQAAAALPRCLSLYARSGSRPELVSRAAAIRFRSRRRGALMPDGTRPNGPGYDEDFYAWTQYQAEVLRSMPCDDNRFDRENVAEEIEDLGKNERGCGEKPGAPHYRAFLEAGLFPGRRSAARLDEARSSTPAPSLRTGCRRPCGRTLEPLWQDLPARAQAARQRACAIIGEQTQPPAAAG